MKLSTITLKQVMICALFGFLGITLFSSCKKDDPYDFKDTIAANVNFINASPDAGDAGLYVENILRTPQLVSFGNASGYNKTFLGEQDITAKNASENTLVSSKGQFDANGNYTVFMVGQSSALGLVTVTDDLTAPAAGKVKIRFVNASPSATSARLLVNNSTVYTDQPYRAATTYTELSAGTYFFNVANGNTRSATLNNVTLESGKIYTVYAKGLIGGSANAPFSVGVFKNN
ncbi:DUF4397 domain-containing protein [Mucilaginibacter sp. Bleaf8]|uniref:DUF4397 domain-containing protein n=1 Tax=Mucilaginibacter sp. Bleaf8 TaxID=2834430 RepID=UPI001BCFBB65|nr:DUF4397 domain-containing protein [Mucilaginibacter sp. Bleaf8]MBS7566409.1 DUF4397 domain-containing protein [Mucilaginibacter sp. Bleaf8]